MKPTGKNGIINRKIIKQALLLVFVLFFIIISNPGINAQNNHSENIKSAGENSAVQQIADRTVYFNVSDTGEYKPIIWGLDLAWLSEENVRRGAAFMGGKENVDVVRSSFMPTQPLLNGKLQGEALTNTNLRIDIINRRLDSHTKVVLNCDHPSVHDYYQGNAVNWAALIDETTRMHQAAGRTVKTVSPFNEPDYGWGQGTIDDFYNIVVELKKNPRFDSIRISGGNTLNPDVAEYWYNYLNPAGLDEGNTHQLAGNFDNYANFFQTVRAKGDHATADELHNVMEAMVGVEYGMQTGIWWGTAEYTRGEFCKASDGRRLGYAEHRPNWTSASVYRAPDGKVQAFGGTSERQAVTTTYRFVSLDRDVFFDGQGPQREYYMVLPGGTGYQQGQTNAECVVDITWGDDIQPVIDGKYIIVNRNSGKVMEVAGGATNNGANVQQNASTGSTSQQWNVNQVDSRIGGDFSYFFIHGVKSEKSLDVYNWSLDNGGDIRIWDDSNNNNQQWYLEYAEDGWFYIRSRHSAKCVEVASNSTSNGTNIQQSDVDGGNNQHWRFLPVNAAVEFDAPEAPANVVATTYSGSVNLEWSPNTDRDFNSYNVYRAESPGGPYNTIARNLTDASFIDKFNPTDGECYYVVKAVDNSLNLSAYSNEVQSNRKEQKGLVVDYRFNHNMLDSSVNQYHFTAYKDTSFTENQNNTSSALIFNGSSTFAQIPHTVLNYEESTISMWINWRGGLDWQRIFDFSNDETESMFLVTKSDTSVVTLVLRKGNTEQRIYAPRLPFREWAHLAFTFNEKKASAYLNGELVTVEDSISLSPYDIKPIFNYIGRGQGEEPYLRAYFDDFRIYNYELSAEEIAKIYEDVQTDVKNIAVNNESSLKVYPVPANDILNFSIDYESEQSESIIKMIDVYGSVVYQQNIRNTQKGEIDVSGVPAGIYMLEIRNEDNYLIKKIIINH